MSRGQPVSTSSMDTGRPRCASRCSRVDGPRISRRRPVDYILEAYRTREVTESSQPRGWSEDVPEAAGERVLDGSRAREVNEQSHPRDWSEDVPEAAGEHSAMDPGRARLTSRRSPVDGPEDVLEAAGQHALDGHR